MAAARRAPRRRQDVCGIGSIAWASAESLSDEHWGADTERLEHDRSYGQPASAVVIGGLVEEFLSSVVCGVFRIVGVILCWKRLE